MLFLKSRVASNAIWIITGKVVQSLLALIINMFTARYLGPSNYGLIGYATSIVAFVIPIMNLGFSNILVQELTNNPESEGSIIGTSISLSVISAVVCMIGCFSFTLIIDHGEKETNIVVLLYSVLLIFQAMDLIEYWFQAKLLSKYMAIVSLCAYFFVSVYKVFLLINKASVYLFALSNAIDYFLIAVFLYFTYRRLKGTPLSFSWQLGRKMFNNSRHYIVSSIMVTIFAQTDKIMLKMLIDKTAVGYYTAAVTCAGMASFVFGAIIDSFRPSIFSHKKINDDIGYEKRIEQLYSVIIYLALLQCIVMCLFAKTFVSILYGEEYFAAISALRIIVWYTTFSYMGAVRNIWILGENKQKYLWVLNLGGALTNIILNLIFIPLLGINGAALASLITQIFTNVIMNAIVWPLKHNNYLILKGLNPRVLFSIFKEKI